MCERLCSNSILRHSDEKSAGAINSDDDESELFTILSFTIYQFYGVQSVFGACDIRNALFGTWFFVISYVIKVHRFADKETRSVERVADMEFGVFRLFDDETCLSLIPEDAMAIGQPRDLYPVALAEVVNMDTVSLKSGTLGVSTRCKRGDVCVPIGEAKELREKAESGASSRVCSVNIAPETLERGGRDILVKTFPNDTGKELKVIRSANLALHFVLYIHPQG